jgi:hypothetical protein
MLENLLTANPGLPQEEQCKFSVSIAPEAPRTALTAKAVNTGWDTRNMLTKSDRDSLFLSVSEDSGFLPGSMQTFLSTHTSSPEDLDPFHADWPHWSDAGSGGRC